MRNHEAASDLNMVIPKRIPINRYISVLIG